MVHKFTRHCTALALALWVKEWEVGTITHQAAYDYVGLCFGRKKYHWPNSGERASETPVQNHEVVKSGIHIQCLFCAAYFETFSIILLLSSLPIKIFLKRI